MSRIHSQYQLQVPATLRNQLLDFRRRVWTTKMTEAVGVAVFAVAFIFLCVFALDRLWDTPTWMRWTAFILAILGCMVAPFYWHRWVWQHRAMENLARLLSRKLPRVGDRLLGILELAHSESEQARSRRLCEAAIEQVAADAVKRDFRAAAPKTRHRLWSTLSAVCVAGAFALFVVFPAAASSSMQRFLAPWSDTPRYTFTAIEAFPGTLIVPHGEPFTVIAKLSDKSVSHPDSGSAELAGLDPLKADLQDNEYKFQMPAILEASDLHLSIGDWTQTVRAEPMLRPELTSLVANVRLPDYLGRPEPQKSDVRGGAVSLVKGSRAGFLATISRDLASASIDDQSSPPEGDKIATPESTFTDSKQLALQWKDKYGMAGRDPFKVSINVRDDEPPTLAVEDLPRVKVVLNTEQLVFKVKAHDDFGVQHVGMEWKGLPSDMVKTPATGESMLGVGGYDKSALDLSGTFCAKTLGIEPQPIQVRIFADDYLPDRKRVYSAPYTFYVLSPEQHAIWVTEQLNRWHRMALEVRDRELQLYETNKQLQAMTPEELDQPETRRKIENQATAERANGRRLTNLTSAGQDLLREAARNPELPADQLESWAQMLEILKDISANRMPSVADLLKKGAQAPNVAGNPVPAGKNGPIAGQVKNSGSGQGAKSSDAEPKKGPAIPSIADTESGQQPANGNAAKGNANAKPKDPRLGLPQTTLIGAGSKNPPPPQTPAGEQVQRAVKEQKDLLAEFAKVADELNKVLANLEGSTLVKRLKAASRKQYVISGKINDQLNDTFGVELARAAATPRKVFEDLGQQELKGSQDVSYIMDDMQAYFERRQLMAFKTVLDDMRTQDVIGSLRKISDDLPKDRGVSMSQCEYWSDVLDRWAEDLVESCKGGACNCPSRASLPPAIVLEVLQILEGEVNLREETRVTQQAKAALETAKYDEKAQKLSETQDELAGRVSKVIDRIRELPDGETEFAPEIGLLTAVDGVMKEATGILARPETGNPAIAAETEAIELLLKSKRINPKAGGGGGANPGGGGGGNTTDAALAMVGAGVNQKEVRDDRGIQQATGQSGPTLPEEFRAGLNQYFSRLEGAGGEK